MEWSKEEIEFFSKKMDEDPQTNNLYLLIRNASKDYKCSGKEIVERGKIHYDESSKRYYITLDKRHYITLEDWYKRRNKWT